MEVEVEEEGEKEMEGSKRWWWWWWRRRGGGGAAVTSGPDCLVTSVPPSILPAYSATSEVLMTCTPPLSPLVNVPRPRPPARICDLMTTCSSPIVAAAATASSTVVAGRPKGTLTPFSAMSAAAWYSCRLRFLLAVRSGAVAATVLRRLARSMREALRGDEWLGCEGRGGTAADASC